MSNLDSIVAARYGIQRSPDWARVARDHLLKQPACLVCGTTLQLNVHHKYPFHYVVALGRPDLELDERNLFTLCEVHHLLDGHFDDWESYASQLEAMLALCRGLTGLQIRAMEVWQEARNGRPAHLDKMLPTDKLALKAELDRLLPRAA